MGMPTGRAVRRNAAGPRARSGTGGGRLVAAACCGAATALNVCAVLLAMAFGAAAQGAAPPQPAPFELATQCAAGFVLREGVCRLHSAYQQYTSLQGAGVGGLKAGLPALRDGYTPQQIDLGRYLFFDPVLSRNGRIACASCHDPGHGFSDARPRSVGVAGGETARHAPGLWNVGFLHRLFRDGRARTLEEQVQGPLYGAREMGNTPEGLVQRLSAIPAYRRLFGASFADARDGIRSEHVYRALAAFESSLIALNSRYDLYAQGFPDALTHQEVEGLNVFRSFVARCAECHTPPLFLSLIHI